MIYHVDDMTERERFAEDHGYWLGRCRIHGSFWTDGTGCEQCLADKQDYDNNPDLYEERD